MSRRDLGARLRSYDSLAKDETDAIMSCPAVLGGLWGGDSVLS